MAGSQTRTVRRRGVSIVETAAAMSLLIPLIFALIYAVTEISYAYLLKSSLAQGARQAARDLAIAYGQNPAVAGSRSLQEAMVFQNIRINNIINSNAQFDDPVFNTGVSPHTVFVNVKYLGSQYGLPPFPNPDVLNLGSKFVITADSTYRLE